MSTQIRIIDNKKLSLTQSEWELYNNICKSYTRTNFKGEILFKDLFESDNDGIIIFVKPPASQYTSMEVYLFVCSIMVHQNLRQVNATASNLFKQLDDKIKQIDNKLLELSHKMDKKE